MTIILGDIHGNLGKLSGVMSSVNDQVLCVGDVGIGFRGVGNEPDFSDRFFFIRGNHDNPYFCKKHSQFVGDYGLWNNIFVLGGARSVDKEWRTENINWWRDEELSYAECQLALEAYDSLRPDIIVSHDAPFSIQPELRLAAIAKNPSVAIFGDPKPYPTSMILDAMLEVHRPRIHIFGHWHCSFRKDVEGTRFICLDIFETLDLEKELSSLEAPIS